MLPYLDQHKALRERFKFNDSFLDVFQEHCRDFAHLITPHKQLLKTDREPTHLSPVTWTGEPIELLFYDIGYEYEIIESAWNLFSPFFIDNKTIFVFQPYATRVRKRCAGFAAIMQVL